MLTDTLTEKQLDVIPEIFACSVSGKYFLKSAEIRTPEKTPCNLVMLVVYARHYIPALAMCRSVPDHIRTMTLKLFKHLLVILV
jgi:hypothetical protein